MRGGRSFLILLVLALGIGAYIYFVESRRDPLADDREELLTVDTATVDAIEITPAGGETTRLVKTGEAWQIVEPITADADESQVTSVLSSLSSLRIERVLEEAPDSVEQFGLAPPQTTVAYRVAGGTDMTRLQLGKRTPTGADLYARVEGNPRVVLIAAYVETQLARNAFDLRDKTVLPFAAADVESITLNAGGAAPIRLARTGTDWRLDAPVAASADSAGIDAIVNAAAQARMQSVVAENAPADLTIYGLAQPRATATFAVGESEATLALGADAEEGQVYARDVSRPLVFTVDQALFDRLTPAVDDLRDRDIFEMRSFTATGLDVTYAGQTFSFAKDATPADTEDRPTAESWSMTAPEPRDVDTATMTNLLNGLGGLRAESFSARPLASGDVIEVTARFGDATAPTEEHVTLRISGDTAQAIRPSEPGAAVIPTASAETILTDIRTLTGQQ